MSHFLKYISVRLFLGTVVALFAVFGLLAWVHEVLYQGQEFDDRRLILWGWLAALALVSALMSVWGRWRFGKLLESETRRLSREYHPQLLMDSYRRLTGYLHRSYFFNTTRTRLERRVSCELGRIMLGLRVEDEEALRIYEQVLTHRPEENQFYEFLILAWSRRGKLSERSFQFLRRRWHVRPDDRLVGILAREYLHRGMLTFESERVLERVLRVYPRHRRRLLEFVIPRLVPFRRLDDNAARFYLAALEEGLQRQEVLELLTELRQRYRAKGRDDDLAHRVVEALRDGPTAAAAAEAPAAPARPSAAEEAALRFDRVDYAQAGEEPPPARRRPRERFLSLESRCYGSLQRLLSQGRGTLTVGGGWVKPALLAVLTAVLIYLAQPLVEQAASAWRSPGGPAAVAADSLAAAEEQDHPAGSAFTIQVGSFSDSLRAAGLAAGLRNSGADSRVSPSEFHDRPVYRVRVGIFPSDSLANRRARQLAAARLIREWQIVPCEPIH